MSAKPSASIRAKVSDTPPGLVGEMIRTGLVGQSAAEAICERPNPTAATAMARMRRCMSNPMNTARAYDATYEFRTLIPAQPSYALLVARSMSRRRGHCSGPSPMLSLLLRNKLPDLARRQGKRAGFCTERGQRMSYRVRERATGGDDAAFARALHTQRIVRRRIVLRDHAAQVRKVGSGRQEIVGERAGEELALVVILQMLEAGAAEPLHEGTDHLAPQRERIDGAAHILNHDIVDDLDLADLGVDCDMRRMCAVAVSVVVIVERAFGGQAGELAERKRAAVGARNHLPVDRNR